MTYFLLQCSVAHERISAYARQTVVKKRRCVFITTPAVCAVNIAEHCGCYIAIRCTTLRDKGS